MDNRTKGRCKRCGNDLSWGNQRRQYGRLIRQFGYTPEQAGRLMPMCQKCVTVVVRGGEASAWSEPIAPDRDEEHRPADTAVVAAAVEVSIQKRAERRGPRSPNYSRRVETLRAILGRTDDLHEIRRQWRQAGFSVDYLDRYATYIGVQKLCPRDRLRGSKWTLPADAPAHSVDRRRARWKGRDPNLTVLALQVEPPADEHNSRWQAPRIDEVCRSNQKRL
jgi:hypothetical protein